MLRFIFISILAVLLCSCIQQKPADRSLGEQLAEAEAKRLLWNTKFEQLPGTHISQLNDLWGKPEKLGSYSYRWAKTRVIEGGGYYAEDGHTSSKVYRITDTGISKHVGYIKTPKERYVEPHINESIDCDIRVTTNKRGEITQVSFDGVGNRPGYLCSHDFPLP